ncbi:RagB/SusD family nutrient uptake outer membrane protein [Bacteroidota bacterium]
MKRIFFIITVFIISGIACTDLDEEIFDGLTLDQYPENPSQVASISASAYTGLKPLIDDEGWWFLAQEITSDEFCGPTRDADWYDGGKWVNMHQHNWTNDDEGVNRMWEKLWIAVTTCNISLDIMRQFQQTPEVIAKIREVETVRSLYYYLLLDNFGDIPYLTSKAFAPEKPSKITREAVFDSLVTTVERALPSLKLIDNKNLATRYMAFSLLAKLYLNAEVYTSSPQWNKADAYIDSVLAGPYSFTSDILSPFVTSNENSSEIIFSIPYDEDTYKGFRLHMRSLHYHSNLTYNMAVGPWNGLCVTPNHFDTYENSDIRKDDYFLYGPQFDINGNQITDGVTHQALDIDPHLPAIYMTAENYTPDEYRNTGARVEKYEIAIGAKENLSNDFPLFRITDFYLMKAETQIRLLGDGSGDGWINQIRARAGVSSWTGAGLDSLLAERGRELWVEGHRRQDLIRYGKFTNAWWAKGDSQGGTSGDPSVKLFPIPKWATDANPNLLLDPQ